MNKTLLTATIAGMFTAGLALSAAAAGGDTAMTPSKEKCYGIAKAGKNDCKASDGSHGCAGHATADNNKADWVYVATGTCEKSGGSLK